MLHFHYDLHECVLGEIILLFITIVSFFFIGELTKILQGDDLRYFTMMNVLNEKKKILNNWLSQIDEPEHILDHSVEFV